MINKIQGIIVSETAYGDTSKIINIFTKEHGLVGVMCKGAKSMKSKLRAVTAKFIFGDFHMYYKPGKLSTLISVDVINSFDNLKSDITLMGYLNYIGELVTQVFKQSGDMEIYDLFIKTLEKVNDGMNPEVMTSILEIKLLDYLGVGLNLDGCSKCGNKNIVTIDADIGGYICKNCLGTQKIVDDKTIKMLRMYYYVEIDSITSIDIKDNISREISYFLDKYYERYTGIYTNSKDFLKKVR